MKPDLRYSILAILAGTITCAFAQEKTIDKIKVPTSILKAFQDAYPTANVKAYKTETENGKTCFEIESIDGKINRDLLYTAEGVVVEIEESVEMKQLPEVVAKALKKDFPSGKIAKSEKTTKGADISYEFVVTSGKKKYEASYSPHGKLVDKEEIKAKKDKGENEEEVDD